MWVEDTRLSRGWNPFAPGVDSWPVSIAGAAISRHGEPDTMFLQGVLMAE